MATDTEELVFEETSSRPAPPRNPFTDPSQRRRTLPAIAATIFIAVLGIVLFATMVPRHSNHITPATRPTATATPGQVITPSNGSSTTLNVTNVFGADIVGPNDAWIGNDNEISHFSGDRWISYQLPNGGVIRGLAMTSSTDGWAVGDQQQGSLPLMLHYTNGAWQQVTLPFTGEGFLGIQMLNAGEGWAWSRDILLHYTNQHWQPVTVGFANGIIISGFSAVTSSEAWLAAGTNTQMQLWHLHNGQWSGGPTFNNLAMNPAAANLSMISATEGWAATYLLSPGRRLSSTGPTDPVTLHYHNGQWAQENPDPNDLSAQKYSIDGLYAQGSDVWATIFSAGGVLPNAALHFANGHWSFVSIPPNFWIHQFLIINTGEVWAVGESITTPRTAIVAHFVNGAWVIVNPK